MNVLLSIKPKYVNEIFNGSKNYEFRKNIFKNKPEIVWIYASSPVKKIVGAFVIENILSDTPENLWANCEKEAGINKNDFFKYYKGKNIGYALKIKEYKKFEEPIDPYLIINNFTAPQSFCYMKNCILSQSLLN